MIAQLIRFLKRIVILLPGFLIAYLSVREVFPYVDQRVRYDVIAIVCTYIIAAYILIPALMRLIRLVLPPKHLPQYCITPDGFASDPLNVGLIGTREQLVTAMKTIGWHEADPLSPRSILRTVASVLFGRPYHNAPMSRLYLFGNKQDIAFELPFSGSRSRRHHVRFWAVAYLSGKPLSAQAIQWQSRPKNLKNEKLLWVGAASLDTGFSLIRHNGQITHMIHPDTDTERELILSRLLDENLASFVNAVRLADPYTLVNRVWRGYLQSDGVMKVCELQRSD